LEEEKNPSNSRITKDQIFSKVFKDKELFIMFMQDFIKESWTYKLNPTNIELFPTKFIDLAQGNKESDIIYKITIDEKDIFVFVLLEHHLLIRSL